MKVLQVFDFFSPHGGGTVDVVGKLSRALARKGHEVVVYTSDYKLDQKYLDSFPEVEIHTFHCLFTLANFYLMPGMVGEVKKRLKEFEIIHLHCFRSFQNIVIHHYTTKYGVPYILDAHGSLPRKPVGEQGFKWLLRWFFDIAFGYRILEDACKVVAETEVGVSESKAMGVSDDGITLIKPPLAVEEFAQLP
jgi:glycosyltransferase involved in cell wall biosynthesis